MARDTLAAMCRSTEVPYLREMNCCNAIATDPNIARPCWLDVRRCFRVGTRQRYSALVGWALQPVELRLEHARLLFVAVTGEDVIRWLASLFPATVLNLPPGGDKLKRPGQVDSG